MTENKGDLISREALKKAFKAWKTKDDYYHNTDCNDIPFSEAFDLIDNAPTVEPTFKPIAEVKFDKEQLQEIVEKAKADILAQIERPRGEWVTDNWGMFHCNYCMREKQQLFHNFCSYCGADMRGEDNGERNAN